MNENIKPSEQKVTVSFRYYWRVKFAIEEGRWICYVPWMPRDKEVTIDVPVYALAMMQNEKDEAYPVPKGEPYHNARRYYRMLVTEELDKKVTA